MKDQKQKLASLPKNSFLKTISAEKYLSLMPDFKNERTQSFTTLVFTLVALSIFGIFAIGPTLSTIANLHKQLEDSSFVNQQLAKKIENITSLQAQYFTLEPDFPLVFAAVPESPTVPPLVGQLQAIAQDSSVEVLRAQAFEVGLTNVKATPNAQSYNFSIDVSGTYENLTQFLDAVSNFDRIISLDSVSYNRANETDGSLPFQLSIRGKAYFLR